MSESGPGKGSDHPTLLVRAREGHDLLCFLEHLIPIEGRDYALLSPVDTPVSLFRLNDNAAVSYTHLTLPTILLV